MLTRIVKENINILLPVITKIINLSLKRGEFPVGWKIVIIIILLKNIGPMGPEVSAILDTK